MQTPILTEVNGVGGSIADAVCVHENVIINPVIGVVNRC